MSANRKMLEALESLAGPVLRERGFVGRFPVFRRTQNGELHILELQFSVYGPAFRLNLGVCSAKGITTKWGEFVPADKVTTGHDVERTYFLDPRNITEGKSKEHWFGFSEGNVKQIAQDFLKNLEIAETWFLTGNAPHPPKRRRSTGGFLHRFLLRVFTRPPRF
jgi:hypothetical protein